MRPVVYLLVLTLLLLILAMIASSLQPNIHWVASFLLGCAGGLASGIVMWGIERRNRKGLEHYRRNREAGNFSTEGM